MPDTYTLSFQNFRSLRDVTVDIAPLTVVYGPNGSGKSSLALRTADFEEFSEQSKPASQASFHTHQLAWVG